MKCACQHAIWALGLTQGTQHRKTQYRLVSSTTRMEHILWYATSMSPTTVHCNIVSANTIGVAHRPNFPKNRQVVLVVEHPSNHV